MAFIIWSFISKARSFSMIVVSTFLFALGYCFDFQLIVWHGISSLPSSMIELMLYARVCGIVWAGYLCYAVLALALAKALRMGGQELHL